MYLMLLSRKLVTLLFLMLLYSGRLGHCIGQSGRTCFCCRTSIMADQWQLEDKLRLKLRLIWAGGHYYLICGLRDRMGHGPCNENSCEPGEGIEENNNDLTSPFFFLLEAALPSSSSPCVTPADPHLVSSHISLVHIDGKTA